METTKYVVVNPDNTISLIDGKEMPNGPASVIQDASMIFRIISDDYEVHVSTFKFRGDKCLTVSGSSKLTNLLKHE